MAIGTFRPPREPQLFLSAQVIATLGDGWVTVISLGPGIKLSRWFPEEEQARRYPHEVIEWLNQEPSVHA